MCYASDPLLVHSLHWIIEFHVDILRFNKAPHRAVARVVIQVAHQHNLRFRIAFLNRICDALAIVASGHSEVLRSFLTAASRGPVSYNEMHLGACQPAAHNQKISRVLRGVVT